MHTPISDIESPVWFWSSQVSWIERYQESRTQLPSDSRDKRPSSKSGRSFGTSDLVFHKLSTFLKDLLLMYEMIKSMEWKKNSFSFQNDYGILNLGIEWFEWFQMNRFKTNKSGWMSRYRVDQLFSKIIKDFWRIFGNKVPKQFR